MEHWIFFLCLLGVCAVIGYFVNQASQDRQDSKTEQKITFHTEIDELRSRTDRRYAKTELARAELILKREIAFTNADYDLEIKRLEALERTYKAETARQTLESTRKHEAYMLGLQAIFAQYKHELEMAQLSHLIDPDINKRVQDELREFKAKNGL